MPVTALPNAGWSHVSSMAAKPESNTAAIHKKAGNYFLDVKAANLDSWTVKIDEKK